jgi:hypothetical protein
MKTNDTIISEASERELAAGVLKQAAHALRRFHGATTAVERELYQDDLREEVLGELSLGALKKWARRGSRALRRLSDSLTRRFATRSRDIATTPESLIQTSY